jgi:hypothetical protein
LSEEFQVRVRRQERIDDHVCEESGNSIPVAAGALTGGEAGLGAELRGIPSESERRRIGSRDRVQPTP